MSDWTSLSAIMRDLSVAQGCKVPASLEPVCDSAPPTGQIEEETEEQYYKSFGDVDYTKPPDYEFIQQMLKAVKNKPEKLTGDILSSSNLNPLSSEFDPTKHIVNERVKKRKEKNVAIQSILQNIEKSTPVKHKDVLKDPMKMFKTKAQCPANVSAPVSPLGIQENCIVTNGQYKPSSEANVYYNKYIKKAKLKEDVSLDIWAKLEKELKKKDELTRKRMLEDSPSTSTHSSEESSENASYKVYLQQHRHLLLDDIEDCIVCEMTNKHGYCFNNEQ